MELSIEETSKYTDKIVDFALEYGPSVIGAIITLFIGLTVIKWITNSLLKQLKKRSVEPTLIPFIGNMTNLSLKVLLVISVAGILGIQTTSFIAVLGAAGLAIGMALQGSLGNFAGGVLILIFRPFKVGSVIKAQGHVGEVREILLFVTVLKTLDNQIIYIPNGPLAGGSIQNLNQEPIRRVDMKFGIGYGDDIDAARSAFQEVLNGIPEVLKDPAADIIVVELGDNSVNFAVRPWCKTEYYWDVYAKTHESVKKVLDQKGISIPFPQRDVHLHQVQ